MNFLATQVFPFPKKCASQGFILYVDVVVSCPSIPPWMISSFFENTSLLGSFFAISISGLCSSSMHMKTHIAHTACALALYSCNKVSLLNFELGMDILHSQACTSCAQNNVAQDIWMTLLYVHFLDGSSSAVPQCVR